MSGFTNITNNTVRMIVLFPTESYPNGIILRPGKNKVPNDFLEEFKAVDVDAQEKKTKKIVKRFPGKEVLASLQKDVEITLGVNHKITGPQITVGDEWQPGELEGPPLPYEIESIGPKAALALVAITQDMPALKRWSTDSRPEVASAARAKLVQMGATAA